MASLRSERQANSPDTTSTKDNNNNNTDGGDLGDMHTFFFSRPDDFSQVVSFVHEADAMYNLRMQVIEGDFKSGLQRFVAETGVQAIFIGTRRYACVYVCSMSCVLCTLYCALCSVLC